MERLNAILWYAGRSIAEISFMQKSIGLKQKGLFCNSSCGKMRQSFPGIHTRTQAPNAFSQLPKTSISILGMSLRQYSFHSYILNMKLEPAVRCSQERSSNTFEFCNWSGFFDPLELQLVKLFYENIGIHILIQSFFVYFLTPLDGSL